MKAVPRLKDDPATGLAIPEAILEERRLAQLFDARFKWLRSVKTLLTINKMEHRLVAEENGVAIARHLRGTLKQRLVFDVSEEQMGQPPNTWIQMVHMWFEGKLQAEHVFRLLTPQEQQRVMKRTGRMPAKPGFTDKLTRLKGGDDAKV